MISFVNSSGTNFLSILLKPIGVLFGMCPALIAPTIPNLVLSEHLSISFWLNAVVSLIYILPLEVNVLESSSLQSKSQPYLSNNFISFSTSKTLLVNLSNFKATMTLTVPFLISFIIC